MKGNFDLGRLVGRREAFSVVAGRCSAADAAILREVREKKLYEGYAADWGEFCSKCLHISKTQANRIIRYLEEFGPTYFEVAQLTRLSPQTYRAIAPLIRDHVLYHNGDAIALIAENAEKVAAVVDERRKSSPRPPEEDPIARLERKCNEVLHEIEVAAGSGKWSLEIKVILNSLLLRAEQIERTM